MKRTWVLATSLLVVLVLLMGMGAGACGGGEAAPTGEEEEEEPPAEEEEEAPPGEEDEAAPELPQSGEWVASTGSSQFTFTFTISPDRRDDMGFFTYEFEEFGCGGYQVGEMSVVYDGGPIHTLPSGAGFGFASDHRLNNWHIVVEGSFDETGTYASGTWEITADGTTCAEGTWEASAP